MVIGCGKDTTSLTYCPTISHRFENRVTIENTIEVTIEAFPIGRKSIIVTLGKRNACNGFEGSRFRVSTGVAGDRVADSSHLHIIIRISIQTGKRERIGRSVHGIPFGLCALLVLEHPSCFRRISRPRELERILGCIQQLDVRRFQTSRDVVNKHISYVDIIISTRNSGLTIESNLNRLAIVSREIQRYLIALRRDVIIDTRRAGIVPLLKDSPCSTAIRRNKHYELIISLSTLVVNRVLAVEIG